MEPKKRLRTLEAEVTSAHVMSHVKPTVDVMWGLKVIHNEPNIQCHVPHGIVDTLKNMWNNMFMLYVFPLLFVVNYTRGITGS